MLTSIAVIESVGGIEVLALLVNCTRSSVAVTCRCLDHDGDGGVKDHDDDVDDYGDNKTIGDEGITVDFSIIKVHTSN